VIVVDSSVWIDFFGGMSTPEVERLDGLLGVTPLAIGDLILVEVMQGLRTDQDVATARQLFRCAARGSRCVKTIDGIIATACIEANLPLLFSDRDFHPYAEHLDLEVA
jgi:predicted nucleic acid-binding protein